MWLAVTHLRMRSASAMREYLPAESSSTMISLRPAICACITRHWPASLMKPVFCRPMSQVGLATRRSVVWNCTLRRPSSTSSDGVVEYSRSSGTWWAAFTSTARSRALDLFWLDRPVGST